MLIRIVILSEAKDLLFAARSRSFASLRMTTLWDSPANSLCPSVFPVV